MPTSPRRPAVRPNTRLAVGALVLTASLFVLGCPPVRAADCNSQDLNMRQLTECADQRLKRADADLNTIYAAVQKKIEAPDQKRLRDAERAWMTFRDTECLYRIGAKTRAARCGRCSNCNAGRTSPRFGSRTSASSSNARPSTCPVRRSKRKNSPTPLFLERFHPNRKRAINPPTRHGPDKPNHEGKGGDGRPAFAGRRLSRPG